MSETKTYRILFQGDSITDVGRARNDPRNMGQGYPVMVAGSWGCASPENTNSSTGASAATAFPTLWRGSARISSI